MGLIDDTRKWSVPAIGDNLIAVPAATAAAGQPGPPLSAAYCAERAAAAIGHAEADPDSGTRLLACAAAWRDLAAALATLPTLVRPRDDDGGDERGRRR